MRGVPRERRAISRAARRLDRDAEQLRAAQDDLREILGRVEVEPDDVPEAREERRREQAGARRRADEREGLERDLDRAREGALARHDVDDGVVDAPGRGSPRRRGSGGGSRR